MCRVCACVACPLSVYSALDVSRASACESGERYVRAVAVQRACEPAKKVGFAMIHTGIGAAAGPQRCEVSK